MKKLIASAFALIAIPTFAQTVGPGPQKNPTNAGSTATVSVTIPGVVGVDLEGTIAFDFNQYSAATQSSDCVASANHWPISITCAAAGTGSVVYYPTSNTSLGTVAPSPVNAATAISTLTPSNDKGIWLALFCSKSSAGAPALNASLSNFVAGSTSGFGPTNFYLRRADAGNSTNPSSVGYTADQQFTGAGPTYTIAAGNMMGGTLGAAGAVFGWTRADQVLSMKLPYNSNIGDNGTATAATMTLTFTITK